MSLHVDASTAAWLTDPKCLLSNVLVTRLKSMPTMLGISPRDRLWEAQPAIKLCATVSLDKKETKKAATSIRHAINKVIMRAMDNKSFWLKE